MNQQTSLFSDEERIIAQAETLLDLGADSVSAETYRNLLTDYKKLYRQSKRLVKMGDRMLGELETLARHDSLTGIYNRRYFLELGGREVARVNRNKGHLSLVYFDVDHFKKVNDQYGHEAGDSVLVKLSGMVKARLRETDVFGRIGGEEFAVLMPDTDMENACRVAEELRKMIQGHGIPHKDRDLHCTASFGVSSHGPQAGTLDAMMRIADNAMYRAKDQGRNKVYW